MAHSHVSVHGCMLSLSASDRVPSMHSVLLSDSAKLYSDMVLHTVCGCASVCCPCPGIARSPVGPQPNQQRPGALPLGFPVDQQSDFGGQSTHNFPSVCAPVNGDTQPSSTISGGMLCEYSNDVHVCAYTSMTSLYWWSVVHVCTYVTLTCLSCIPP